MHEGAGLYQRFREQKLLNLIAGRKIVVAVSGGADSVALLHLLWRLRIEKKWDLVVAHIQHHLRGDESVRDQRFVESLAERLGLSCVVRSIRLFSRNGSAAAPLGGTAHHSLRSSLSLSHLRNGTVPDGTSAASLPEGAAPLLISSRNGTAPEGAARILRYRALARIAHEARTNALLTAHTANDQTETFFLNLLRGSGLDGLCGIHPLSSLNGTGNHSPHPPIQLVRPLLPFGREEILNYLHSQKLKFCNDSSNRLLKYRRNWIRHRLIPQLKKVQPQIVRRISELMTIFQQEKKMRTGQLDEIMNEVLQEATQSHSRPLGIRRKGLMLDLIRFFHYDIGLRTQLLHRLLPRGSYRQIDQIHDFLQKERLKGRSSLLLRSALSRNP